jgi:hypothetical protein
MKVKGIIITVLACVLLLLAGTLGFSRLYHTLFHPETVIQEDTADSTAWQETQSQYEKEILYPLSYFLEEEIITEVDDSYLLSEFYLVNQDVFSSLLELADVNWTDVENASVTTYKFQTGTTESEEYGLRYLFHIVLVQDDRNHDMIIALDEADIPVPVLFQSEEGGKLDEIGNTTAITSWFVSQEELPETLRDDLAGIDAMLGKQVSYSALLTAIGGEISSGGQEIRPGGLVDYCEYGEWKVYSDAKKAAYVCILGDCHFILYYEIESGKFCGYSIALNNP